MLRRWHPMVIVSLKQKPPMTNKEIMGWRHRTRGIFKFKGWSFHTCIHKAGPSVGINKWGGPNSFKLWEINYSGWLHRQIGVGQSSRNWPAKKWGGGADCAPPPPPTPPPWLRQPCIKDGLYTSRKRKANFSGTSIMCPLNSTGLGQLGA